MSDPVKPESIQRRESDTDRLRALTDFAARFAPAIGETRDYGHDVDGAADDRVNDARDRALTETFHAVARIAAASAARED